MGRIDPSMPDMSELNLFDMDPNKEIKEKKELLNKAQEVLKTEFIGIDRVIDEVIDSITSWYMVPDLQERPNVISLFGMTGVGKTALLSRLKELLRIRDRFYHMDLGERHIDLREKLEELHDNQDGQPFLICLDEFQHARSIREGREEENQQLRILWELMDTGKFSLLRFQREVGELRSFKKSLEYMKDLGVVIQEGQVVQGKEICRDYMPSINQFMRMNRDFDKDPWIISKEQVEDIVKITGDYTCAHEVYREIGEKDTEQLIRFLERVVEKGRTPRVVDCSKALLFVVGNLDEAYRIGDDHDAEIEPDELRERSMEISIPDVKAALKTRFRSEQIARLGNQMITYPAFDSGTFQKIIENELDRTHIKVFTQEGLHLEFHESVHELIYDEGVFPLQGARPVFSTIQQLIKSRLGSIIAQYRTQKEKVKEAWMSIEEDEAIVTFLDKEGQEIDRLSFRIRKELGALKESKQGENQTLCGVHESGHATIAIALMGVVPEVIVSQSIGNCQNGFTSLPRKEDPLTKKDLELRGIMMLAGLTAEKMVFGKDNVSPGSGDDLGRATEIALRMEKTWGMGTCPGSFFPNDNEGAHYSFRDTHGYLDRLAKERVEKWKDEAQRTLRDHWGLFIELSDRLSKERKLKRDEICEVVEEVEPEVLSGMKQGEREQFRRMLDRRTKEIRNEKRSSVEKVPVNGKERGE